MFRSIEKRPFLTGFLIGFFVSKKLRKAIRKIVPNNITIIQLVLQDEDIKNEQDDENNKS